MALWPRLASLEHAPNPKSPTRSTGSLPPRSMASNSGLILGWPVRRNCSVEPWKNGRSASSPQRSSRIASVSPLSQQRGGWTTPRTGQPRVLASRETSLHGWRTNHFVPTPRVSSSHSAPSPGGGGRGRFVGCSVGIEEKPAGGRAHGLTEQLRFSCTKTDSETTLIEGDLWGDYKPVYEI